ncbi:MAG: molybdopterin oxidoreductase family protein [Actinomycetota bacterium]|nr:molybdopterin oxidoreductase family protein [Actinomycetota bacterium]
MRPTAPEEERLRSARTPPGVPFGDTTTCPYCSLQCGMSLRTENSGFPSESVEAKPAGQGGLCRKGWTSGQLLSHSDRLLSPMVRTRKGGALVPASWSLALDRIAEAVGDVQDRHGPDAVGVFGGGGLTNEKAYQLGKFARVVLRTPNVDYNGRFCMSSAAVACNSAFGVDRGLPFPLSDVSMADVVILAGANPAATMPPAMRFFTALIEKGGTLVVIDPRRTATAKMASVHLQPVPGTDLALANAMLNIAIRADWIDREFVRQRTSGFDEVREAVASYWPDRIERLTGVPVNAMTDVVRAFATAEHAMILTARGVEQHTKGTDTVAAFINLALATGHAGKLWSGFGTLTGQGNGQGGREHGLKADQLPGYRSIADPAARRHVAEVWGVDPDTIPGPGTSAYEMLSSCGEEGGVRALLVMGSNPVVSAPDAAAVESRLSRLQFLAVADPFMSDTARLADVVLPVAQWAEEDGTTTNLEGRVLRRRRLRSAPTSVRTDLEVLSDLAARLGHRSGFSPVAQHVFDELARASAGGRADYSGITYVALDRASATHWPAPRERPTGTPRLFLDSFSTTSGRARFSPVFHRAVADPPDESFPIYLTTGRLIFQYQSGTQTSLIDDLRSDRQEPSVEMHPFLARQLDINDGDMVDVTTPRGTTTAWAHCTSDIRIDTVFLPFHFPASGRANLVTNPELDPRSKMPEFKVCAASIRKHDPHRCNVTNRTNGHVTYRQSPIELKEEIW